VIPVKFLRSKQALKWVPIGWSRIAELVLRVQSDSSWENEVMEMSDSEDDYTVADLAAPYWQHPVGPTWWCHVTAGHPSIDAWLNSAHWMHPAIRTALRDESKLISDRMKYLLYEVFSLILICLTIKIPIKPSSALYCFVIRYPESGVHTIISPCNFYLM